MICFFESVTRGELNSNNLAESEFIRNFSNKPNKNYEINSLNCFWSIIYPIFLSFRESQECFAQIFFNLSGNHTHKCSWVPMSANDHSWHDGVGWLRISISWKIISALTSWMFLRVCDEVLIKEVFHVLTSHLFCQIMLKYK